MKSVTLLAGLALAAAPALAGGNLLNNAGFEDDLGFDFSDPTNWNGFFGGPGGTFLEAFNNTGETPRSGNNALRLTIEGVAGITDGFQAFTGHSQAVSGVSGGDLLELSVWARGVGDVTNGAEYRIEFFDAGGNVIGGQFDFNTEIQNDLTDEYQRFSRQVVAPDGTASAAVVLAVQSFLNDGVIADISVAFDDASLVIVPTPGAVAMLGLGGLVAARRRR